ncbi:MAG: hypothetical protein GY928_11025 [Colwellia sp.]|nr:hypothetical protein [Colwellia sp.]
MRASNERKLSLLIVILMLVGACTTGETDLTIGPKSPSAEVENLTATITVGPTNSDITPPVAIVTQPPVSNTTIKMDTSYPLAEARSIFYIEEGHIKVWYTETNSNEIIFMSGDVVGLSLSDDGHLIGFLRRLPPNKAGVPEQYAIWAVNSDGHNPHELVSAKQLREGSTDLDATYTIAEVSWLPNTHTLAYSSFVYPGVIGASYGRTMGDLQLINSDTASKTEIIPPGNGKRFIFSPDGKQIAVITGDSLSFVNADGSNWRRDSLSFTQLTFPHEAYYPDGVWTTPSTFTMAVAMDEYEYNDTDGSFTVWQIPSTGSLAQKIATINGRPDTVVFSPDRGQIGYVGSSNYRKLHLAAIDNDWSIVLERGAELSWTPTGEAFYISPDGSALIPICLDISQKTTVDCRNPLSLIKGEAATSIHWIDETYFLFTTYSQNLYLGSLDSNHKHIGTLTAYDGPSAYIYPKAFKPFAYH